MIAHSLGIGVNLCLGVHLLGEIAVLEVQHLTEVVGLILDLELEAPPLTGGTGIEEIEIGRIGLLSVRFHMMKMAPAD